MKLELRVVVEVKEIPEKLMATDVRDACAKAIGESRKVVVGGEQRVMTVSRIELLSAQGR